MKKSIRRGLAAALAAMLAVPAFSVAAEEPGGVVAEPAAQEVSFNTGSKAWRVGGEESDVSFAEDGSYTINIPEENPFFPYEVQFTCGGEVENRWFMTPEDSVEVGGHTFYVSAYIDGTVATQASMEVGGDTVVIYPQEKEFTDGDGGMELSLLPLKTENFTVDLRGYTPVELTRVQFKTLFGDKVADDVSIMWNYYYNGYDTEYEIDGTGKIIDLSYSTYRADQVYDPEAGKYVDQDYSSNTLYVIAGTPDQLDSENTRYNITQHL